MLSANPKLLPKLLDLRRRNLAELRPEVTTRLHLVAVDQNGAWARQACAALIEVAEQRQMTRDRVRDSPIRPVIPRDEVVHQL